MLGTRGAGPEALPDGAPVPEGLFALQTEECTAQAPTGWSEGCENLLPPGNGLVGYNWLTLDISFKYTPGVPPWTVAIYNGFSTQADVSHLDDGNSFTQTEQIAAESLSTLTTPFRKRHVRLTWATTPDVAPDKGRRTAQLLGITTAARGTICTKQYAMGLTIAADT